MAKTKRRGPGEKYRPSVIVIKEKDGIPTRISINGQEYHATYHEKYISSKIDNTKARRAKKREALQQEWRQKNDIR